MSESGMNVLVSVVISRFKCIIFLMCYDYATEEAYFFNKHSKHHSASF